MKKLFTFVAILGLLVGTHTVKAQDFDAQAERQTREMASMMKLNEAEFMRLKNFNLNRMHQIAALANLREQDSRYLDMRLDMIEEEYASTVYNTFSPKQYAGFKEYRKSSPYTYAGVTSKFNKNSAVAIQKPE
jgi:hypothetical protein